jgi:hypothetical protein
MSNSLGETPLHLSAINKSNISLFKTILDRTNLENIKSERTSQETAETLTVITMTPNKLYC